MPGRRRVAYGAAAAGPTAVPVVPATAAGPPRPLSAGEAPARRGTVFLGAVPRQLRHRQDTTGEEP